MRGEAETLESGLTVGLRRRHCSGRICRDRHQDERPPPHSVARLNPRPIPKPESCRGIENLKTEQLGARHYSEAAAPPFPPPARPPGAHCGAETHKRQDQARRAHGPTHWPRASRSQRRRSRPAARDRPREPATWPRRIDLLLGAVAHRGVGGVAGRVAGGGNGGMGCCLWRAAGVVGMGLRGRSRARWTASGA